MIATDSQNLLNFTVKLLTWAASPIGVLCLGFILGWFIKLFWSKSRLGTLAIAVALLQLVAFSLPPVAHQLHSSLENRAAALAQTNAGPPYDAILLLGGLTRSTRSPLAQDWQLDLTQASDRATHAAGLWHQGIANRIIVAGGVWSSTPPKPAEAFWIQQLLLQMGVPQEAIVLEDRSRTTRENVQYVAQIMRDNGWDGRLAMVTSASHMPRAHANASVAGLRIDAYPTDWQAHALMDRPLPWLPNAEALEASTRALKEWIAIVWNY